MSVTNILLNLLDSLPWQDIPVLGLKIAILLTVVIISLVVITGILSKALDKLPNNWFSKLCEDLLRHFVKNTNRARTSVTSRFIGLWTPMPTLDPVWVDIGDIKAFLVPPSHRDPSKWEIQVQMKEITALQDGEERKVSPYYLGSDKIFDTKEEAHDYLIELLYGKADDGDVLDL